MRDMISNVLRGTKDNGPRSQPAGATERRPTQLTNGNGGGGSSSQNCRTVGNTDPHHACLLSLRCVSATGITTKGYDGHVGYAGGPRGCSGAGAAPPALGKEEEKVTKGGQTGPNRIWGWGAAVAS